MINSNYFCRFGDVLAVILYLEGPVILAGILNNGLAEHEVLQEKTCSENSNWEI